MKLGFHKKKELAITDPLLLKIVFKSEFDPDSNDQIREIIDQVSDAEASQSQSPLSETLPYASFKTAEDLFSKLREMAAQNAQAISFQYAAIWEYDSTSKVNNDNPTEMITIENFEVGYDYQNLTKSIFEEIFNDINNADVSYDDKVDYCKQIQRAYQESTNVSNNDIARIPEIQETENGMVALDVPSFSYEEEDLQDNQTDYDSHSVYDPQTATFSQSQADSTPVDPAEEGRSFFDQNPDPKAPVSEDIHREPENSAPMSPVADASRSQAKRMDATNQIALKTNTASQRGYVAAPRFDIETLAAVAPEDEGFVNYMLNERKKHLNGILTSSEEKVNAKNTQDILNIETHNDNLIKQAVDGFKVKSDTRDSLATEIHQQLSVAKKRELAEKGSTLAQETKKLLEQAKKEYEASKQQINEQHDNDLEALQQSLVQKYEDLANQQYQERFANLTEELQTGAEKVRQQNILKFEVSLQNDITDIVTDSHDVLEQVYDDCLHDLADFQTQVTVQHTNALQARAADSRAEASRKQMIAPFEENRELTETSAELREQISKLEAEKAGLQKQNSTLEADASHAQNLLERQTAQANIPTVVTQSEPSNGFSDFLKWEAHQQTLRDQKEEKENANVEQTTQLANRGVKRLAVGLFVLVAMGSAGAGYWMHKSNAAHADQVTQLTKKISSQSSSAKAASLRSVSSSKVAAQSSDATNETETSKAASTSKTNTTTTNQIDKEETKALHANKLDAIKKADNATFQKLDEALLTNNAEWVESALAALPSLNLKDNYRSQLTQSVLNNAGNKSLATSVEKEN